MKLSDVENIGTRCYFTVNGKSYVLNKAILELFGDCEVKSIHLNYGKCVLVLENDICK